MAFYRLEKKIISRGKSRRSVVAAAAYQSGNILHYAAYRSGEELADKKTGITFNYRARTHEVVHSEILAPKDGPLWLQAGPPQGIDDLHRQRAMRERLWNTVERVEKRKDSQLACEILVSLDRRFNLAQKIELVRGFCESEFISKGYIADFSIHASKNGGNPHCHILRPMRPLVGPEFGKKPNMAGLFNSRGAAGLGAKSELEELRASWERHVNAALKKAGIADKADHRSLKDRGIDREPEPKMGPAATAMKRRGLDPERFKLVRYIRSLNFSRPWLKAIERAGEVHQQGLGKTWWERSLIMAKEAGKSARESVVDTWAKMVHSRHPMGLSGHEVPPPSRGPDLSR